MDMENGGSTVKKVFTAIGNVIIWLFVVISALITVYAIAFSSSKNDLPAIGNKVILTVLTDSMEDTFYAGDVIIGEKLTDEAKLDLQVGDIITFETDVDGDGNFGEFNSHRIVKKVDKDGNEVKNGPFDHYVTQGDKAKKMNINRTEDVVPSNVECKYTGVRIPHVGAALDWLRVPTHFLLTVVLPLILFFIFELIMFILKLAGVGKKAPITADEEERIRQQAIAEYLRSQNGDAAGDAPVQEAKAPAEEAPAEEAPAEEAPAEETPAEEAPTEETPAEEAPTEETPAEEATAEESATDEN